MRGRRNYSDGMRTTVGVPRPRWPRRGDPSRVGPGAFRPAAVTAAYTRPYARATSASMSSGSNLTPTRYTTTEAPAEFGSGGLTIRQDHDGEENSSRRQFGASRIGAPATAVEGTSSKRPLRIKCADGED